MTHAASEARDAQVKDALRAFIADATSVSTIDDDADLFESGLVNSLFAIQLMTFIEKSFSIEVGVDDLDMDNFRSIAATCALVLRKQDGQTG